MNTIGFSHFPLPILERKIIVAILEWVTEYHCGKITAGFITFFIKD